jgi:hypothetical protein
LYKLFAIILALSFYSAISAQNNVLGGWYVANLNYHLNQNLALYSEVQARSQHLTDDFFYRELKAGMSYSLPNKQAVFVGFGNYKTFTFPGNFEKPLAVNENRIWEQFTMSNSISRVKIEHRYRIEQRWLNGNYASRFRYRLATTTPLNHSTVIDKTIFISVFDEVFFTNKVPYFLRNRIYMGAGYQINKLLTIQTGFIRQFDYRTSDNGTGKNFILTSFIFNAGNSKRTVHHANAD